MSQNLMWGLLAPAVRRTLKLLCVLKVLGKVKQLAKFQHRISVHHTLAPSHGSATARATKQVNRETQNLAPATPKPR